ACTGIGDADGDGVCADVDCDDNDPAVVGQPGSSCDDGNPNTINDVIDSNCNCAGVAVPCPGVGDADGDGLCADVDCDDSDPGIAHQPGDACNDGNPNTIGETIQADCSCGGGSTGMAPILTCDRVDGLRDDAEEQPSGQIRLASNDLELINDANSGNQVVGLRFGGLRIPRGAYIVSARLQFTAESPNNDNPADLTIYGEASGTPLGFRGSGFNLSSRPRTNAMANWLPSEWTAAGQAGFAQQSPDLSPIIQEIIRRAGYASSSAIVLLIEGTGRRAAESYEGFAARAPQLCVEYLIAPPNFDCPERLADFGAPCDDGNPGTYNDQVDANCNCAGTPAPCPGIGDNDGDGVCADTDCDDNDPAVTYQPGDACDDGNPGTIGETIQPDCSCGGGSPAPALSCARIAGSSDDAVEAQSGQVALTGSKLELAGSSSQGSQLVGLRFSGLDIPRGARILRASLQFTVADTQNESLCELRIYGEASDNARSFAGSAGDISRRPATNASVEWMPSEWQAPGTSGHAQQSPDLSAVLQEIVGRGGYASSSAIAIMIDGVGRRAAQSFDGSASEAPVLCVEYLPPAPVVPRSGGAAAPETSTAGALLVPPARQAEVLENLSVYPNPATDRLTAAFTSAAEGPARIQAVDMNGKAVLVQERDIHKGENAISLESLSLPEGIYVLQVISGSSVQSVKFIIVSE
ncbi:MAG: T9SS type A sorting domain-containing protein, partial [Phaeodactylibacter sp.]|nr:T9SS type A sorting domain-containing protein [Phaeodactylibacter sp.]